MHAISTPSVPPTSPTTSCRSDRRFGPNLACSKSFTLKPSGAGNERSTIGSMRATSAFAASIVTPGLRRATPV